MALIVPNFIELGQKDVPEKRYIIFYTLQYFWYPRGPPGPKFTSLCINVQQDQDYQYAEFLPLLTTYLRNISADELC